MFKSVIFTCFAIVALAIAAVLPRAAQADLIYSANFNSPTYLDVPLIGQDGWVITGTSVVSPIAVAGTGTNGNVSLVTTGQDVNRPFTPALTTGSVFLSANITINSAQATGDYFLHLSDGTTTNFYNRIYARSSAGGFQMALATSSGTPTYGTTELSLGTTYNILARYDILSGLTNDTGALFVNPADPFGIGDTPYVAASMIGADATTISALNLRQGTAGNAPTVTLDNITVSISAVPEPSSFALLGLAVVAGAFYRRRYRARL